MKTNTLFAALLSMALLTAARAQEPAKVQLDHFIDRLAEKNKAMGSLVIAKEGNILYNRAFGYSQINQSVKKPSTASTRYRVGSITKMFTAGMIFQLIDEKKLSLSDTLSKFLPQVPSGNKITIEQLLAHRSGIHDVSEEPDFRSKRLDGITKEELLSLITKGEPDFEPGTKYAYSNTGYQVLRIVIEKITGKQYAEVLNARIATRIGLKDSYDAISIIDPNKNECFSYRYAREWEQQPETHFSLLQGSGSLVSTPLDLAIFIQALFDGKLISQSSLDQMVKNRMGIDTFMYHGKTGYGHTGGIDGFGAWLVYLPEEKLVVSYASNGKVYPVSNIIDGVLDIYWNKPFQIPTFESMALSPEILDKYTGVYSTPEGPMKFTVTRDSSTLFLQMTGRSPASLEATSETSFKIEGAGIVIEFNAGKKQMKIIRSGGEKILNKED